MSMELMVLVNKHKFDSPIQKLVFLQIADNANKKGNCWPSYQYIADVSGCGKSTVRKHLKILEKKGYLTIKNRRGEKGNSSNYYHINKARLTTPPVEPVNEPKENNIVIFRKINVSKFEPAIDANIAKQWITYRAGMEKPITSQETFDQQMREAIKTSEYFFGEGTITPNDVITKSIDAGWVGIGTPAWFLHRGFL